MDDVEITPSEELVLSVISDVAVEGVATPETESHWPMGNGVLELSPIQPRELIIQSQFSSQVENSIINVGGKVFILCYN